MRHMQPISRSNARRGVILMVVLALLTLFAILGLSFVLYANSQAKSSDLALQAQVDANGGNGADISPDTLANNLLNVFIYGQDDKTGIYSAYRGHDFTTLMYGANYTVDAQGNVSYSVNGVPMNNVPFNGSGRLHEKITFAVAPALPIDGYSMINTTCYLNSQGGFVDSFVVGTQTVGGFRDPERMGIRTSTSLTNATALQFVGGSNVSWTYPDFNNMFLAAVRADGSVLTPSFHRGWLTNPADPNSGFGPLDPNNLNWYDPLKPWLKYQVLRPRPVDQLLANEIWQVPPPNAPTQLSAGMPYNTVTKSYRKNFFPPPADQGGDVKNIVGSPGTLIAPNQYANSDSIWMDFGFPVLTTRDGKKYKPLAAVLMTDLDNRVNVNVHGNTRGVDPASGKTIHVSNQGWGPWEVSLSSVLRADYNASTTPPTPQAEWIALFNGKSGSTYGRYGSPDRQPGVSGSSATAPFPGRFYSAMDTDATKSPTPTGFPSGGYPSDPFTLPTIGDPNAPGTFPFPFFPGASYSNGDPFETLNHPSLFNYFQPDWQKNSGDSLLSISNMEALLRYGDVGTDSLRSEIMSLCANPAGYSANFNPGPNATQAQINAASRIRRLITTLSMDFDRPGSSPWARSPLSTDATAQPYTFNFATGNYPKGSAMPSPQMPGALATLTANNSQFSEFSGDGRSLAATLGRVDLNRKLTDYPPAPGGQIDMTIPQNVAQLNAAVTDRQQLAKDIYDRFRLVTMGESPNYVPLPPASPSTTNDQNFEARRWLAQLAVNIVDYIDNDDYMTPFLWYIDPGPGPTAGTKYYVFGTELPRVVLNEAYAEYVNTGGKPPIVTADSTGTSTYDVNFWVELLNTYANDPARGDPGIAYLQAGTNAVYKISVLQNPNNTLADSGAKSAFNRPDNSTGDVSLPLLAAPGVPNSIGDPAANFVGSPLTSWGPGTVALPPNNRASGVTGYMVVGPTVDFAGGGTFWANLPPGAMSYQSASMNYTVNQPPNDPNGPPPNTPAATGGQQIPPPASGGTTTQTYGIYLQRLAAPGLPAQTDPTKPYYNPYITVDYIGSLQANLAIGTVQKFAEAPGSTMNQKVNARVSFGRTQPYGGFIPVPPPTPPGSGGSLFQAQTTAVSTTQPLNSFFNVNDNAKAAAFDWLPHLDRQVISPVELLNTSMFKPHQLTQVFVTGPAAANKFQHRLGLAVMDETSRLYRGFEFLTVGGRGLGMSANGRVPGKININTIWDMDTFQALSDPQQANSFQAPDVQQFFKNMLASRTMSGTSTDASGNVISGPPGPGDQPFTGFSAPLVTSNPADQLYPGGSGIKNTIFRLGSPTQFLLENPTPAHPSLRYELMNKIYNNVTTRSNVFAIWMTIGFFEVIDDTTRPAKLGAEIGLAQHQNTRHRIFAIVDRTNLRSQSAPLIFLKANSSLLPPPPPPPPYPPGTADVSVDALSGTYEGNTYTIQAGTNLLVDVGLNQEVVTVVPANPADHPFPFFRAVFSRPHAAGFVIIPSPSNTTPPVYMGNPGPQQGYNALQDSAVVRYYNVIN